MSSKHRCPCCNCLVLDQPPGGGSYDICQVCFWEDDPVQFKDENFAGGANRVSLREARANFQRIGASDERVLHLVRPPTDGENP
jgi:Cysteine-rich CPCC